MANFGPAGARVMVIDDSDTIRHCAKLLLEQGGHRVSQAKNGFEALLAIELEQPDLIFLDIMMPRMDGWEVLERLKEDASTASIPVVLLTARTSEEDQIRGWGEGILEYLSKPFNPQRLVEWAEQAMTPRDTTDEDERRRRAVEQLRLLKELRRQQ